MSLLLEEQTVDGDFPTNSGHFADDYDRSLTGAMSFARKEESQLNAFGDGLKNLVSKTISKTKDVLDGSDAKNERQAERDIEDARRKFEKGNIGGGKVQLSKAIGDLTQAGYTHVQKMDKICPAAAEFNVDYKDCRERYPNLYPETEEERAEGIQSLLNEIGGENAIEDNTLKNVAIAGGIALFLGIAALLIIKSTK